MRDSLQNLVPAARLLLSHLSSRETAHLDCTAPVPATKSFLSTPHPFLAQTREREPSTGEVVKQISWSCSSYTSSSVCEESRAVLNLLPKRPRSILGPHWGGLRGLLRPQPGAVAEDHSYVCNGVIQTSSFQTLVRRSRSSAAPPLRRRRSRKMAFIRLIILLSNRCLVPFFSPSGFVHVRCGGGRRV